MSPETDANTLIEGGIRINGKSSSNLPELPLISIITVTLNGEKHLEEAIRSILDQDYQNIEYIIIDGGSTDGTLEIIHKYEKQIDYWASEPDKGLYDAMNKGISLAHGDIIGILNADDYYAQHAVQQVVESALAHPEVEVFHGNLKLLRQNGVEEFRRPRIIHRKYRPYLMPVNHPTVFARSSCYAEYGNFDTRFRTAADFELMLRFLYAQQIEAHYIDQTLTFMREGGESGQYCQQTYRDIIVILEQNSLPRWQILRFRLWYLWLWLMQYSKRFRWVRALAPLYYKLNRSSH